MPPFDRAIAMPNGHGLKSLSTWGGAIHFEGDGYAAHGARA